MDKKMYIELNATLAELIEREPNNGLFVKLQRLGADIIDTHKRHELTRQQYNALMATYQCAIEIYRAELR